MYHFTYLFIVFGFWLVILFFDVIFRSCLLTPYVNLLNDKLLTVKPGFLQWYTTSYNRKLQKWGCWRPKLQKNWFSVGTLVTCLLMPVSVIILLLMARNVLVKQDEGEQILQPVLPGVNLPLSEVAFYFLTLLFCSVIHELGHALAATREEVKVEGFGVFFAGIIPGAFVSLPTEEIAHLLSWQQLRIFCAGVWHNVFLALCAYFLLVVNPYILLPLYQTGNGVTCTNVLQGSGISGPTGLKYSDHISSINNCAIKSKVNWLECIDQVVEEPQLGFCISPEFLKQHDSSSEILHEQNCCSNLTISHLCFRLSQKLSCLPVRKMLAISPFSCSDSEDCDLCAKPVLDNHYRLLKIGCRNRDAVLFVGNPVELKTSVEVNDYTPRSLFVPITIVNIWEKLLNYILAFSGALAILNVVPCWGLDGQWIIEAFVDLTLHKYVEKNLRQRISCILMGGGTALLAINVLFSIYFLFR